MEGESLIQDGEVSLRSLSEQPPSSLLSQTDEGTYGIGNKGAGKLKRKTPSTSTSTSSSQSSNKQARLTVATSSTPADTPVVQQLKLGFMKEADIDITQWGNYIAFDTTLKRDSFNIVEKKTNKTTAVVTRSIAVFAHQSLWTSEKPEDFKFILCGVSPQFEIQEKFYPNSKNPVMSFSIEFTPGDPVKDRQLEFLYTQHQWLVQNITKVKGVKALMDSGWHVEVFQRSGKLKKEDDEDGERWNPNIKFPFLRTPDKKDWNIAFYLEKKLVKDPKTQKMCMEFLRSKAARRYKMDLGIHIPNIGFNNQTKAIRYNSVINCVYLPEALPQFATDWKADLPDTCDSWMTLACTSFV